MNNFFKVQVFLKSYEENSRSELFSIIINSTVAKKVSCKVRAGIVALK